MKFNSIQKDEVISLGMNLRVTEVYSNGDVLVEDLDGLNQKFVIKGDFSKACSSAIQYSTTKKVTKTELVRKLMNARDRVFSVWFVKQDGTKRELTGILVESNNEFGRSDVIDLDIPASDKNRRRQVDHNTMYSLIINDIKYDLK